MVLCLKTRKAANQKALQHAECFASDKSFSSRGINQFRIGISSNEHSADQLVW